MNIATFSLQYHTADDLPYQRTHPWPEVLHPVDMEHYPKALQNLLLTELNTVEMKQNCM